MENSCYPQDRPVASKWCIHVYPVSMCTAETSSYGKWKQLEGRGTEDSFRAPLLSPSDQPQAGQWRWARSRTLSQWFRHSPCHPSASWLFVQHQCPEKQMAETWVRGQQGEDNTLCPILGHKVIVWRWKSIHIPTCLYSICLQQDTQSLCKAGGKGMGLFFS